MSSLGNGNKSVRAESVNASAYGCNTRVLPGSSSMCIILEYSHHGKVVPMDIVIVSFFSHLIYLFNLMCIGFWVLGVPAW